MKTITLTNRNIILTIGLLLCSLLGFSQSSQTFTSSGTWTCPAGVTTITVEAWGAGGAGGGNTSNRDGGGGGGGGAYSKSTTISVTPGVTYTVNVGTGGTGTTVDGTAGGDSWFDSTSILLAKGGAGGISGTLVSGAAGGNGGATASGVGTTKFSGGRGGAGRNSTTGRGGPGGSSAGTAANGTSGAATWSTITAGAAPTGGGNGGDGGDNTLNGNAGTIPGGGGGGAGERVSSTVFTVGGNGANGQVIISWACSATHSLTSAATASGPICQGSASTITLTSSSMATGNYTVTYSLSGANTATGNTTTMTFTAGSPGTGSFTTSSLPNTGATTATITSLSLGTGCPSTISTNNTANITVNSNPTAVAGTEITACSASGAVNITTGSSAANYSSVTWTSNGTGTFANPNSLTTCTYTPSAADIAAGSIILTLTATGNAPCTSTTSTKAFTIITGTTAVAGTAITTCSSSGAVNITTGSSATNYSSVTWTSNGTGTFTNANSLTTCTYTPSAADKTAGNVTLTLTSVNTGCTNATSTKIVTINGIATSVAGTAITTCSTSGAVNITSGSSATNYSSITWTSSGSGAFINANSLTTCTYTPSAADIAAGSVTLTLTAFGNSPCGNTTSTKTLTISGTTTVTGTTPRTRTGSGSVVLGATTSIGSLNWYDSLTGGSLLGTGTSFTTPAISATTTFYVEAVNGGCSSTPRTAVVATINYPEIDLQGNATSIANGDITPSTSDWTDFGTSNSTRTFTIRNIGNALLTIGTISISGANSSDFSITAVPSSVVAIGSSTTFTVTFSPSAIGLRTASISIDNNDTDENPYSFDIQGTGVEQEIDIQGNSISINSGDSSPSTSDWTDFGSVAGTRTFTIRNTGNVALNIGTISFTGVNASEFTVTTPPSSVVGANGSTTFVVTFSPTAINNRAATINIANDDSNESLYTFALQGFGIIPEIDIQGNVTSIPDSTVPVATTANWTDFSSVTATRTFTVFNNGNITLNVGAITFTGTNASEFMVTTPPSATVAAFSTTSFVVTFTPTAIGTRTAVINIVNNDNNENPYNFNLQGTGTSREIDVQGNSLSIVNGDAITSVSDGTDFGPADINLATVTRTFTILNTGSLSLTISNPTITGVNASEFSISANPGTLTIGAGSSTTFSVTFNPSAVFTRVAQINIVNNDSDENPYTFAIQGTGLLDNDGDGINNNADLDDDNDGIIDTVECGSCISDIFVNGSFETPVIGTATYAILPTSSVTGWQTSAENFIEIWSSGMNGGYGAVPAAAGNQFAELNANIAGILYQTFCLNGAGGTINWSIKHRGRAGSDQAFVKFGDNLTNAIASTPIVTMVDGNTSWGSYSGTYSIPLGQTSIVLTFQAGYTASGDASIGNLIDDVQIIINQNCIDTDSDGIADINDVDSDNDGIPDIEESGFKTYSNNTATMDKTNSTNWRDTNTNGLNDYIDSMISISTYSILDTDSDGIYNHLDLDSDNDTLWDVDEAGLVNGDGDINDDGKGDGLDTEGDGLLNLFDNSTSFGSTFRAYAQDSDGNGISDYLQLDANDDGINDIQTSLYGSFDTNGDGIIDGSGDSDRDGILNIFDTDDILRGSPRDLNRKLYLDFDGRNDYAENTSVLGGLSNASLMAWIDLNTAFSGTGTVVGQDKFHIKISSARTLQAVVNGTTVTFGTALNKSQWYHVAATYGGGNLTLYLNGKSVATQAISGSIAADASKLTLGKDPLTSTNYFKGKIDEVRVFNVTLTNTQVQRMVHQEIQNTASQVRGAIVPKDIGSLPFANVLRYYRMDTYKDDIVDDLTTASVDTGTGMKLYNHKVINYQQAPMPFTTIRTGTFSTAVHDATKDIRGLDVLDFDYSIIQVKHNITETANNTDLGMFVDPGVTVSMTNDNKLQNDWYLDLDGKIDLVGKSQLVQTINSDLEVTSAGSIERDQEGQSNKYNYNYWSSPVGALSTTSNNNAYTVDSVMKDGTDPNNIKNITWVPTYDGAATSPITLSNYWIFKFQNVSPIYANWSKIGPTGSLSAGQGFTLKGSAAGTATQNYTFVGKPNSGAISSPIAANNSNLSGNPYPSALDANTFINDNLTSTTGTLYFWEHYSTNSSHVLVQYQGGYATRNLVGATAPVSPAGISGLGSSTRVPGRYIPVGQGFFVNGSATGGTINFNNGQRAFVKEYDETNSNPLFRQSASSVVENEFNNKHDAIPSETEFTKIRLGFNSANDFHRQLLLGFMDEKATSGIDAGYDATLFDIQPNDMYFLNTNTKLVIQGDSYFNTSNVYPLGVKTAIEGKVKFTLDATEKLDADQNVYIYDNVTNEYHDIRNKNFEVSLPAGIISDRFSLRFKNTSALGVNNFDDSQTIAVAFTNNNNSINIKNDLLDRTVKTVTLYNILGQSISTWDIKNENQTKIEIPVTTISTGTYIVKVHTTKGDVNKKIIIK